MKTIEINNKQYEIIEDVKEAIDKEILKEKITDYYDAFDYIVGDWAYGKLRLKGFYDSKNKKAQEHNKKTYADSQICLSQYSDSLARYPRNMACLWKISNILYQVHTEPFILL